MVYNKIGNPNFCFIEVENSDFYLLKVFIIKLKNLFLLVLKSEFSI